MAARNELGPTCRPPLLVTTLMPWWLWKIASTSANTNMPRISKMTPVLLISATRRTP